MGVASTGCFKASSRAIRSAPSLPSLSTIEALPYSRSFSVDHSVAKHSSQGSEGSLAERHGSVLLAKTPGELEDAYDKWADQYDEDLALLGEGVNVACSGAAKVLAEHTTPAEKPRLIDLGCGTGASGAVLHKAGWRDFVGVDLSSGMLKVAERRGIYRELLKRMLPETALPESSFDVVHAAGLFAPGQGPPSCFDEFVRLLKPGGLAVFTIREHYHDGDEGALHRIRINELVAEGKWKQVIKTSEPYLPVDGVDAYVFVMEACK